MHTKGALVLSLFGPWILAGYTVVLWTLTSPIADVNFRDNDLGLAHLQDENRLKNTFSDQYLRQALSGRRNFVSPLKHKIKASKKKQA